MTITRATMISSLLAALLAGACSSGGGGGGDTGGIPPRGDEAPRREDGTLAYVGTPGVATCSVPDLNAWVTHDMRDYYIYHDRVPELDTAAYDDPEALVRDLRVAPDRFSNLTDAGDFARQFEEGALFGIGAWFYFDETIDRYRARLVEGGSPIEEAGAMRGDVLLAINGRDPDDFVVDGERWDERVWGVEGVDMTFTLQTGTAPPRELTVTPADFEWLSVPWAAYVDRGGQRIGYLEVAGFDDTTAGEIDFQLDWLVEQGIDDLVLDLRYNGGGRTWVARRLAAQIAGASVEGERYMRYVSNERYPELTYADAFEVPELTLALPRVVALVTDATASASEALISGLEPYIDVTVIGTRTFGKPFVSVGVDHCDRTLSAMRWESENAAGVSVAGGIEPDCTVEDEFALPAYEEGDRLFAAGLDYLADGTCPSLPIVAAAERARPRPMAPPPQRRPIALDD